MPVGALFVARPEDEISVSRPGVSLCLLIRRGNRALRIIDFRSGGDEAKRRAVFEVARQHGVDRAFTLVERDEVGAWSRLGFQKEGTIVGFYKRTDAHVLGIEVPTDQGTSGDSGIRRAVGADAASKTPIEVKYLAARRRATELAQLKRGRPRVQMARPEDVQRALSAARKGARALTSFEPFSRDVEKSYFVCTARGGFSWLVGVETQPCFDNAFVEPLSPPRSERETLYAASALGLICERLTEQGIVGCFATCPVHLVDLNAVFVKSGFRRTGILKRHLLVGGVRRDAFLWSQRLAQPADD
jgi:hypothetical protein